MNLLYEFLCLALPNRVIPTVRGNSVLPCCTAFTLKWPYQLKQGVVSGASSFVYKLALKARITFLPGATKPEL